MGVLVVGRGDSGTTMVFLVGGVGTKSFLEVGTGVACFLFGLEHAGPGSGTER